MRGANTPQSIFISVHMTVISICTTRQTHFKQHCTPSILYQCTRQTTLLTSPRCCTFSMPIFHMTAEKSIQQPHTQALFLQPRKRQIPHSPLRAAAPSQCPWSTWPHSKTTAIETPQSESQKTGPTYSYLFCTC